MLASFIWKIIPQYMRSLLSKSWLFRSLRARRERLAVLEWRKSREAVAGPALLNEVTPGVNLVGYLGAAKGIGEAARNMALAIQTAGIPHSLIDFEVGISPYQRIDSSLSFQNAHGFLHNCNILHINPPQMPYLWRRHSRGQLADRYTIGVWYWELPRLPDDWRFAFELVDEVWVGSKYVYESVSASSPVPVVIIPPSVEPVCDPELNRRHFGLAEGCFLFLCSFDMLSDPGRKNPWGVIEAYKRAFPPRDRSVGLVVKINNGRENPGAVRALRQALAGYQNYRVIDSVLSPSAMNSLVNATDACISLHRAEGFGLVPAQAMFLGKPVIMTRWSGNVDFMTAENACGVGYSLVPVNTHSRVYDPAQSWAEPDLDQAAGYMRRLATDREYYSSIARRAPELMRQRYSPGAVGLTIRGRLSQVGVLDART